MRGVASETGSISPTIVAKIVIDNIMVTPEKNPSVNDKIKGKVVIRHSTHQQVKITNNYENVNIITSYHFHSCSCNKLMAGIYFCNVHNSVLV